MRPCSKCCENGDCSDKRIFGSGLCHFHYKSSVRRPSKPSKNTSSESQDNGIKNKPKQVSSTPSNSSLKKKADSLLRRLLLLKSKRDKKGRYLCSLTKEFLGADNIHVCHYIGRDCLILRWDELNCVLCSAFTNTHENIEVSGGYTSLHQKRFIEFLGENVAAELNKKSKEIVINKTEFIKSKIEYLNEEISRCTQGIE